MVRHTLKILQHLLQHLSSVSYHFTTLQSKALKWWFMFTQSLVFIPILFMWVRYSISPFFLIKTLTFKLDLTQNQRNWKRLKSKIKRVFTREISSRVETHPGMKSSLSMVKCLLLFTRFCRDEIWSRDERQGWNFIPERKTGMKFHPGMKKRKKDVLTLHPGMKFYNEYVFN